MMTADQRYARQFREAVQAQREKIEFEAQQFEKWAKSRYLDCSLKPEGEWGDHRYRHEHIESMWLGWKSRAALET